MLKIRDAKHSVNEQNCTGWKHTVAFETYQTALILYNRFGPTDEGVCTRYVRRAVTLCFGYVPI